MSGGVALFDFDNDGRLDIYFVNSLTVDTAGDPKSARSELYRNLGGNKFEDVTDRAGVGHPGWGMGVCTADVDGDGWEDLYVTALDGNKLYRNNGGKAFTDVTAAAGVAVGGWSAGCGFADYDRDGDLDLFVSRYVKIDLKNLPQFGKDKTCEYRGIAVQCGPRGLPGESDFLFRNEGNGRFTDVSQKAGVVRSAGVLRARHRLVRRQRGRLAGSLRRQRLDGELPLHQSEGRHVQGVGVPDGRRRQRGRRRAGQHGRGRRRLRSLRPLQPLGDELLGRVQRAVSQRRQPFHRRLVPLADGGGQPAVRRLGQRVLRLRQRFAARPDRRQRPRVSAARQGAAAGVGGLPAAQAALPQSRQRHVRGGRAALRSDDQR